MEWIVEPEARVLVAIDSLARDAAGRLADRHAPPRAPQPALTIRGLIREGRCDEVLSLARSFVAAAPFSAELVYLLGLTLARAGQYDEARRIIDPVAFTRRGTLDRPHECGADDAFQHALIHEIDRESTLAPDPPDTTTREGFQTRPLTPAADTALHALLGMIRAAVEAYVEALPRAGDHPFVCGVPECARLTSWAVVYPEHGRQDPHIHASAWLSGVYYVTVPRPEAHHVDGGALILGGCLGPDGPGDAPWGTRTMMPRAGELILFPSWLPHATRPTGVPARRICVSFDVIPMRKSAV